MCLDARTPVVVSKVPIVAPSDPTDDSIDDAAIPTHKSIDELLQSDLDDPTVDTTVIPFEDPTDDPTEDPTDDPAILFSFNGLAKLDGPIAEGRQDRAVMSSFSSLAIVSESCCAPKSRRAFSSRSVRTSSADASAACVFMDESDVAVVTNVAASSRRCSFLSSSCNHSSLATCARSASFLARHAMSSSTTLASTSAEASALASDNALPHNCSGM